MSVETIVIGILGLALIISIGLNLYYSTRMEQYQKYSESVFKELTEVRRDLQVARSRIKR
jgi:uncharacterized protein YpmB